MDKWLGNGMDTSGLQGYSGLRVYLLGGSSLGSTERKTKSTL